MTEAEAQLVLQDRILPLLSQGTADLPTDATGSLGTLTFPDILRRLDQHLDDAPLDLKIRRLAELSSASGTIVTFQSMGGGIFITAPAAAEIALICQELLNNALKHSGATTVQIFLIAGESIVITIADNGRGLAQIAEGNGLSDLETRVSSLGGTIIRKNREEGGAAFVLTLPNQGRPSGAQRSAEAALGKKLHDGFCQELAVLKMMVTQLRDTTEDSANWKSYRDATRLITQAWEEARDLSHALLAN